MTDRFDALFRKQREDDMERAMEGARSTQEANAKLQAAEQRLRNHFKAIGVPGIQQAVEYLAKQDVSLSPYKQDDRMPGYSMIIQYTDNPERRFKISIDTQENLDFKLYGVHHSKGLMDVHRIRTVVVPFEGATASKVRDAILELLFKVQGMG